MNRPVTLFDHVARHAQTTPQAIALRGPSGLTSYSELIARSRQLAVELASLGLGKGDIVAVQLPNTPEFVMTLLALNALGAMVQMVHMPYRHAELSFMLTHSGARAFVGLSSFRGESAVQWALQISKDKIARADHSIPRLEFVIALGSPITGALDWAALVAQGSQRSHELRAVELNDDNGYVLLYTSGTTADPKGVPITHGRFLNNALVSIAPLEMVASDILLSVAPFTHLYGLFVLELALLAGAGLSLLAAFTPAELVSTVVRDRASAIFAAPAHFKSLLDQNAIKPDDFQSVRFVCLSGSAVPTALARQVEAQLRRGVVLQLWGMSELQAGTYGRPSDPPHIRLESAGCACPGTELRIVDDHGFGLNSALEGRLQVRGPSLFGGYLNNPRASAAAFDQDWFDTGDIAKLTEDKALVITGRVKELINRGGIKFNPIDVELILDRIAGVERCVLVPMTDPVLGERACAFVKLNRQAEITLATLTEALELAGVAKFKWPERLVFIEEMPLTPTQKVMRAKLAALIPSIPEDPGRNAERKVTGA